MKEYKLKTSRPEHQHEDKSDINIHKWRYQINKERGKKLLEVKQIGTVSCFEIFKEFQEIQVIKNRTQQESKNCKYH